MNNSIFVVVLCTAPLVRYRKDGSEYKLRDFKNHSYSLSRHDSFDRVTGPIDISEDGHYEYAVVEEIEMEFESSAKTRKWYKFDRTQNRFRECLEPPTDIKNIKTLSFG